jgi:hydrogenase expression/formation protein HypE
MSSESIPFTDCPIPLVDTDRILLGHGGGGKLTGDLITRLILPILGSEQLERLDDAAVLQIGETRVAFTTDSFVVTPLFFPGGDIGELAVNGTINDLAMVGARPLALSLAFILEEGLPIAELTSILESIRKAAEAAGVPVVTGDTKVVGRGSADRLFINTTGIGVVPPGVELTSASVRPGDVILLSGRIGDHGVAILSQREGLELEGAIESDTAPLHGLVQSMLAAWPAIHALRDPTRGGVAATLVEIASRGRVSIEVDESAIPVGETVRGACELLGLDPLHVANEGKLVAFVPAEGAELVLEAMREHPLGRDAVRIGQVTDAADGIVRLRTPIGGQRILDLPYGELLPRIC